ncbi:MAG: hypothetical protein D6790_09105 [Caldilineae bacterium]|nr:MAG: hypothetical protein D6790_09105 [Caldilineae bacterium]
MTTLTRKAFYDLAGECREMALELARHDQSRVDRQQCRVFNHWLRRLREYDELAPRLAGVSLARPITRGHLMAAAVVLWLVGLLLWAGNLGLLGQRLWGLALTGALLILLFLPESLYGTTIELLEGKLLRIVEIFEEILYTQELQLSEAVFFKIKEDLAAARQELRQQIYLAHS